MEKIIKEYLETLAEAGASCVKVIKPLDDFALLEELSALDLVTLPEDFRTYLLLFDAYDQSKCIALDIMDPDFAWGMEAIPLKKIIREYKSSTSLYSEEADYWPKGFVPFLRNNGDGMLVNCLKDSPTFGAVYCFREGVGINKVAENLKDFISGCQAMLTQGLRVYEEPDFSEIADEESYFEACSRIYGNTPYFNRRGKFDTQIIDWK